MSISSIGNNIPLIGPQPSTIGSIGSAIGKNNQSFGKMLSTMLEETNEAQRKSNDAINNLQMGKAENLHEVMIAMEEADLSLRTLMQIRNKAKTAYDEMMRIQV